jgi:hypothetical protein
MIKQSNNNNQEMETNKQKKHNQKNPNMQTNKKPKKSMGER